MNYTANQIKNAKRNYTEFATYHTIADYDVEIIGHNAAEQRMESHNKIVAEIASGNKSVIREWKSFFLNEEVKADRKAAESKAKKATNKAASSEVLAPIKKMRKLGEFGKWLNTKGNPFRSQHFSKKYTAGAVNQFLATV